MSDEPRDVRPIVWEYTIEITDETALLAVDPGFTVDEHGQVDGLLGWSKEERIGLILSRVLHAALETTPGVHAMGGSWVKLRRPAPDGSYPDITIFGIPATDDIPGPDAD